MKIHTFDTPKETARAVTHQLLKQLDTVRKEDFHLAISGGHTSELLFQLWAEFYPQSLPWQRVHLYWVDERCVSPTDADSNYGLAKRTFLNHVKIPHHQIHRIMGETNPDHEAQRYSDLVKKNLPDHDGFPQFDLLILGIGADGHTSSIFPGQKELLYYPAPYAVSVHPETHQYRIALTGQPIIRASLTLFHVIGAEKAEIVRNIVTPSLTADLYPAAYITQNADHVVYFIDKAAAKYLK